MIAVLIDLLAPDSRMFLRGMSAEIVRDLCKSPAPLVPSLPSIPRASGVYAWWVTDGALPQASGPQHPAEALRLLYVGVSPERSTSSAHLDSRLRGQHIGGNIASSTFRFALAALLFEAEAWLPEVTAGGKYRLSKADNTKLSEWQRQHLRLSWVIVPEPWAVERSVIEALRSPLNRRGNETHVFYERMGAARDRLRSAARSNVASSTDLSAVVGSSRP